jgi:hypothetical protein
MWYTPFCIVGTRTAGLKFPAMPRLPVLLDKHQLVRTIDRVGVQVVVEFEQDGGREGDHADSGLDFGGPS